MSDQAAHIAVVGLMGVGKSTLASQLSEALDLPSYDSDHDIEHFVVMTGADYAAANGVPALHALEATVLLVRLAGVEPSIVSCAGSTIENPACRRALVHNARVLWLDCDVETLMARAAVGTHRRPIDRVDAEALAGRRRGLFAEVADAVLDGRQNTRALADAAMAALDELGRLDPLDLEH